MARKKLGAILETKGVITEFQLVAALSHQRKWKIRLGKALLELGYIEERKLFEVLADQWGLELVDLYEITIPDDIKRRLSREKGTALMAFPIRIEDDDMVIAISEPDRENIKADLERLTGMSVKLVLALDSQIEEFTRTLPEKVSVASVKPIKKAFRKNSNGDIEPVEDSEVMLGGKETAVKEAKKSEPIAIDYGAPAEESPKEEPKKSEEPEEPVELVDAEEPAAEEPEKEEEAAPSEPMKTEALAVDVPDLNTPEPAPSEAPAASPEKAQEPEPEKTPEPEPEKAAEPEAPAEVAEPPKPESGEDSDEFWKDEKVSTVQEMPKPEEEEAEKEEEKEKEGESAPGPEPEDKGHEDFFPGQMRTIDPETLEKESETGPADKGEDDFFPGQMKTLEPASTEEFEEKKPEKEEKEEESEEEEKKPAEAEKPAPEPEEEPELKAEEGVEEIGVSDTGEPVELKEEAAPEEAKEPEKKEEVPLPPLEESAPENAEPAAAPEPASASDAKTLEKNVSDAEKEIIAQSIDAIEQQQKALSDMISELRKKLRS